MELEEISSSSSVSHSTEGPEVTSSSNSDSGPEVNPIQAGNNTEIGPELGYPARKLGRTEENWTRAAAQGTGVVVFGIAFQRIVSASDISNAVEKATSEDALFRAQIEAPYPNKNKYVFHISSKPVSVRVITREFAIPETTNVSHFLTLPGDKSSGYELSKKLYLIVIEELNTRFCRNPEFPNEVLDVLAFHVYYTTSENQTVIAIRVHAAALDRQTCAHLATSFLAALNTVVAKPAAVSAHAVKSHERVVACIEDLIPGIYKCLPCSLVTYSTFRKSRSCSLLPFQRGFGDARPIELPTSGVVSHSLGEPGTAKLLALLKTKNVPLYAIVASAYLKASYTLWNQQPGNYTNDSVDFGFTSIVDCRPLLANSLPRSTAGQLSVVIPLHKKVKSKSDIWELARSIRSKVDNSLEADEHFSLLGTMNCLFSKALKYPNMTTGPSRRTYLFSFFRDTFDFGMENAENLKLAGTYGPLSSNHGPGPCFGIDEAIQLGEEGPELCLSLVYSEIVYSRYQMEVVATNAMHLLRNLVTDNPN